MNMHNLFIDIHKEYNLGAKMERKWNADGTQIATYRSEGFTRTGYFFPGRDGTGAWTFGRFRLPPLKQEAFMFLKHTK